MTCNKCGWVHYAVTREHAEAQVVQFNRYYHSLPKEKREDYYGSKSSTIAQYEKCFHCGNDYRDFHATTDKESAKVGIVTMQPIIQE